MRALTSIVSVASLVTILSASGCSSSGNSDTPPVDDTSDSASSDTPAVVDETAVETGPVAPAYPPGPYGLNKGQTFPLLSFKGYKDGLGAWTDISTASYYDPDGKRGITGIYFVVSAQWCPPCKEEAGNLPKWYSRSYKARGAVFTTAVIEKSDKSAATQAVVTAWRDSYHMNFDVMLDAHGVTTLPKGTAAKPVGLPHNYVINPRTMKIAAVVEGIDPYIVQCASQADCCSPALNTDPTCCDPNDSSCANPCPCPVAPVGGTAADVTWTCDGKVSYCVEPGAQGTIDDLETVMVANGAAPLVPAK